VGPIQPPVQCILDALSLGVKQLGHEADCLSPSTTKVNNVWNYTFTPLYVSVA